MTIDEIKSAVSSDRYLAGRVLFSEHGGQHVMSAATRFSGISVMATERGIEMIREWVADKDKKASN